MNYYKVDISTPFGAKLKGLLVEAMQCEQTAEELAEKIGAIAYSGAVDVDFGGISAFEFPFGVLPDASIFERIESNDAISWYVPKVEVKEQPMPSDLAMTHKGDNGKIVTDAEKSFREIAFMLSRNEAAAMADVTLTEPAIEEIVRGQKISPVEMRMLKSGGVSFQTLFPDSQEDHSERICRALAEDKQIMDALGDKKFRIVITISGSRKAVQLYKQMMSLPTVPRGMTNALLSIDNQNSRSGVAEFNGYIYVCSGTPTTNSELQEVPEEEFLQMKNALESSVGDNVLAQA